MNFPVATCQKCNWTMRPEPATGRQVCDHCGFFVAMAANPAAMRAQNVQSYGASPAPQYNAAPAGGGGGGARWVIILIAIAVSLGGAVVPLLLSSSGGGASTTTLPAVVPTTAATPKPAIAPHTVEYTPPVHRELPKDNPAPAPEAGENRQPPAETPATEKPTTQPKPDAPKPDAPKPDTPKPVVPKPDAPKPAAADPPSKGAKGDSKGKKKKKKKKGA